MIRDVLGTVIVHHPCGEAGLRWAPGLTPDAGSRRGVGRIATRFTHLDGTPYEAGDRVRCDACLKPVLAVGRDMFDPTWSAIS